MGRRGAGLGVVDHEGLVGIIAGGERLVADGEISDQGVVISLGAGAALVHAMPRPQPPELGGPDREVAHELTELGVVGVVTGVHAKHRHGVSGDLVPVGVELAGVWVQEHEAGLVPLEGRHGLEVGGQQGGEPVLSDDVEASSQHG
ncbi:MAG: hypothetical protein AAGC63_14370 [Propionicimonas sp.]